MASEVDPGSAELSILPFCEWWAMRVSYSTRVYLCVCALPLIGRGGVGRAGRTTKVQLLLKCRGPEKGMFGCGLVRTVSVAHLSFSPSK